MTFYSCRVKLMYESSAFLFEGINFHEKKMHVLIADNKVKKMATKVKPRVEKCTDLKTQKIRNCDRENTKQTVV